METIKTGESIIKNSQKMLKINVHILIKTKVKFQISFLNSANPKTLILVQDFNCLIVVTQ